MKYVGEELDLFVHAVHWKRYYASLLRPFVRGQVLDAGCGMGVNAEYLFNPAVEGYTFLEPDQELLDKVPEHVQQQLLVQGQRIRGTTADLAGRKFDTILYLDVIEHIEDSAGELRRASDLLNPGGHLLVLVPAFQFLFSDFDRAVGHFRRYDKAMLLDEMPTGMKVEKLVYLDSIGMLMSIANRLFLKQRAPTLGQIMFWDKRVVPLSRMADRVFLHGFGRSLLTVARKNAFDVHL